MTDKISPRANELMRQETAAMLGRQGIDVATGEKFEVGKGSLVPDYVDTQRAEFKELAREAALECYVKYGYLPASKEAAANWHPHVWVTDAMQKACASESERVHIAELRVAALEAKLKELRLCNSNECWPVLAEIDTLLGGK